MTSRVFHTRYFTIVLGGSFTRFGLGFDANWYKGHGLASIDLAFWYIGVEW